jgi:putative endonuclease
MTRQKTGSQNYKHGLLAETLAAGYFLLQGYRPIARRHKTNAGEIDLILKRGRQLLFVEIKKRQSLDMAAESVYARQQQRIAQAAQLFIGRNPHYAACRFRFDALLFAPKRWPRHIKNAWLTE